MRDFRGIRAAVIEGEVEPPAPGFRERERTGVLDQMRDMQRAALARAALLGRTATGYGRGSAAALVLWWFTPAVPWVHPLALLGAVLTASRALWCWEMRAIARREAAHNPVDFLRAGD
jgi:hypothetical protein